MKKLYKCSVCGNIIESEGQPEHNCIKCLQGPEKFEELSEEAAKKVYDSDPTNTIHAELISLAGRIEQLTSKGIELNLDPGCVHVFEVSRDFAWQMKGICKAELEGHMNKGKW